MRMRIAELNKRIKIKRNTIKVNENMVEVLTEITVAEIWAKVQNMSGTEIFKANSDYSKLTTRFVIRYRNDITEDDYIEFNGMTFNIKYINNYNYSNDFLELIGEVVK